MNIGARSPGEGLEEVIDEFSLEVAHQSLADFRIDNACCAAAEIDGCQTQRFVHGHDKISRAQNPALRSQRFVECFSQNDAHIFHRVVLVHIEIALGLELKVEAAVPGE